jgi:nondiscriminating glutamyl-tRNA synthetase
MEQIDRKELTSIAGVLKDNLVILSDIDHYLGIFYDGKFSYEDGAKAILSDPRNRETLQSVLAILENPAALGQEDPRPLLAQMEEKTGRRGKSLYAPFRAAVTGRLKGPELVKTLPILGRDRIVKRLKTALEIAT